MHFVPTCKSKSIILGVSMNSFDKAMEKRTKSCSYPALERGIVSILKCVQFHLGSRGKFNQPLQTFVSFLLGLLILSSSPLQTIIKNHDFNCHYFTDNCRIIKHKSHRCTPFTYILKPKRRWKFLHYCLVYNRKKNK